MRLSRYTLFIDDFPEESQSFVFNTLTDARVVLTDDLCRILRSLPDVAVRTRKVRKALRTLASMGIVIDDDTDEDKLLDEYFRRLKDDSTTLNATVLTTYDCNFACTYCVEASVKSRASMDDEGARRTAAYLEAAIREREPKKVALKFYGGEPLINPAPIRHIAARMQSYCLERGIEYGWAVTTNGALLTREFVDKSVPIGLKAARVTLDGTAEYHDRTRPYKGGAGSYDRIMKNVEDVAGSLRLYVGGNFDEDNVAAMYDLVDELARRGLNGKLAGIGFKPILYDADRRSSGGAVTDTGCAYADPSIVKHLVGLRRRAYERGFVPDPALGTNLCAMVIGKSSVIVDPLGALYRCAAFVGHDEFQVGSIAEPGRDDFSTLDLWKRCRACVYVPLCGDGCPYTAYLRFGDHRALNCQRQFVQQMVEDNLKLDYEFDG